MTMAATFQLILFGAEQLRGFSHCCRPGIVHALLFHNQDQTHSLERVPWWQRHWQTQGAVMRRGYMSTSQSG
jgi:hypothetical protein